MTLWSVVPPECCFVLFRLRCTQTAGHNTLLAGLPQSPETRNDRDTPDHSGTDGSGPAKARPKRIHALQRLSAAYAGRRGNVADLF